MNFRAFVISDFTGGVCFDDRINPWGVEDGCKWFETLTHKRFALIDVGATKWLRVPDPDVCYYLVDSEGEKLGPEWRRAIEAKQVVCYPDVGAFLRFVNSAKKLDDSICWVLGNSRLHDKLFPFYTHLMLTLVGLNLRCDEKIPLGELSRGGDDLSVDFYDRGFSGKIIHYYPATPKQPFRVTVASLFLNELKADGYEHDF